jgi:hypothetical protein
MDARYADAAPPDEDLDIRHSRLTWWLTVGVVAVGAAVPWYTLEVFPIARFGTAKVNLLDALVALTVLSALPAIAQAVRRRDSATVWILAFMAYMMVPLGIGLVHPDAAPKAIREARAVVFYAFGLVLLSRDDPPERFYTLAAIYTIAVTFAVMAVFAHIQWLMPLPGYPLPVKTAGDYKLGVRYLEWTTCVVAVTLSLACLSTGRRHAARAVWILTTAMISWYVLATLERFIQLIAACTAVAFVWAPPFSGRRARLALGAAVLIAAAVLTAAGVYRGPRALRQTVGIMLVRWPRWYSDGSLKIRAKEVEVAIPMVARTPLFGAGLGAAIPMTTPGQDPHDQDQSISSGYAFLLIKSGLAGLGLYFGMVISVILAGWDVVAKRLQIGWPAATVGLIGMGVLLTLNVLHTVVDIPEGAIAFSLFAGMIASQTRIRRSPA